MVARTHLAHWAAALTLGLGALGCGQASSAVPTPAEAGGQEAATVSLLTLIANAPTSVTFEGTRRFETYWTEGGVPQQLSYREDVVADGSGQFSLSASEVLAPPMDASQETLFLFLQELRQRTMYLARDFGVRDLDLFADNYSLVDTGQPTSVAGVPTQRVVAALRTTPDRRYLLDVDATNGLVLAAREELLDGTLVSLVEYESFSYTPDLTGVAWSQPINDEVDLVPGSSEAVMKLGFKPRLPKVLPDGWQQIGFSKVIDPTNDEVWAKAVYSDGVEQIFYLVAKGDGPAHQLKNPPPNTPPRHADRVSKMSVGSWTLLDADLAQGKALLLGRTDDGVLEGLLQSAFF